jgi:hypothetical protein
MSAAGNKKIKLWDGIIEYDEPIPDAEMEELKAGIDAGLAAFEQHKISLLERLQNVYQRGPKSEPFDAEKSWRGLTSLAGLYFWRARLKQETVPAAHRVERLRELAKALGRARRMVDKAMQDDVGNDLFSAWCEANVRYDIDPTPPITLVRIDHEFEKVIASLAALETAACRAADEVPKARGRPKGSAFLSRGVIEGLAEVYQNSTGSKPGAGDGPFARFVYEFLAAVSRGNIEYESVVDAVKDTRARVRTRPAATKSGRSPFDDET